MNNPFSVAGIIFGIMAITIAIFSDSLANSLYDSRDKSTRELILEKGKEAISSIPVSFNQDKQKIRIAYTAMGLIGLLLAVVSFAKKEVLRMTGITAGLSLIGIAWSSVLLGVVLFVLILLFSALNSFF